MPINFARIKLEPVFTQRCFYLFLALMALLTAIPFLTESLHGRIAGNIVNIFVLLSAIAAVSRSNLAFFISLLLGLLTVGFQATAFARDELHYLPISWMFAASFYTLAISYLLRYVLRPTVMDLDKLYGGAAVYLMLVVLWGYLYAICQHFFPGSFAFGGNARDALPMADLLYYSFTVLTSTGFGDIVPVLPSARSLTMLQQAVGVLYVAILISRLAGVYAMHHDRPSMTVSRKSKARDT
jgi:hypothetical protein